MCVNVHISHSKCSNVTDTARVKHACVIECDWLAKYGNYTAVA